MTLYDIGQYCEYRQKYEVAKTNELIHILSAHATDIVTGFARTQNDKNKHVPMNKQFPQVFKVEKKPLTLDEQKSVEKATWLNFLGK